MRILGILYTHNQTSPVLLNQVVKHIQEAADYSNLNNGVKGETSVDLVACSWEPIPGWKHDEHISFLKKGSPGHLNIATQILRCVYEKGSMFRVNRQNNSREYMPENIGIISTRYDIIVQLEHDVLYAPNYFEKITAAWKVALQTRKDPATERNVPWVKYWEGDTPIVGVSCLDYIGMNETGYLAVKERHEPLSMMAMVPGYAINNYERAIKECIAQGWCFLEPNDKTGFIHIPFAGETPNIHVNMNHTATNHHFTNHYDVCYESDSKGNVVHPFWGDFKRFGIFE